MLFKALYTSFSKVNGMCCPLPQPCFWHSFIFLLDHHNNALSCGCRQVTESAVPSWACLPPAQISALQFHLNLSWPLSIIWQCKSSHHFQNQDFCIGFCVLSSMPSNSWLFLFKQLILVNQLLIRICNTSPEVLMAVSPVSRSLIHEFGVDSYLTGVIHSSSPPLLACLFTPS